MSQFSAKFECFRSMADMGVAHRWAIKDRCKGLWRSLTRCQNKEIEHWVKWFDDAMDEWLAAQKEANNLQVNAQPDEGDIAHIIDAEQERMQREKEKADTQQTESKDSREEATGVKDEDAGAKEKPTAMQESVVEIDKVEEVVALTEEKGDRSSKAVSVVSSVVVKQGRDEGEEEDEEVTGAWKKRPALTPVTKEVKGLSRSAETACDKCREAREMCYEGPSTASKQPLAVMWMVEGQRKVASRHVVNSDNESEVEERVASEVEESEVEVIEASTSKGKGKERAKASTAKGKHQ
ncbi:hypothetical protein OG21DRAFT_1528377, partial [Imleria badia]